MKPFSNIKRGRCARFHTSMARTLVITPVTHIYVTTGKTATASTTFMKFLRVITLETTLAKYKLP